MGPYTDCHVLILGHARLAGSVATRLTTGASLLFLAFISSLRLKKYKPYFQNILIFIKEKKPNMKSRLKSTIYFLLLRSLYTSFTNLNHCQDFRLITRLNVHFTI